MVVIVAISLKPDSPSWLIGLAPTFFLLLFLAKKNERYIFSEDTLTIKSWLSKNQVIPYDSINSVEAVKNNVLKQIVAAKPVITFKINYNKYDEFEICSYESELIRMLRQSAKSNMKGLE